MKPEPTLVQKEEEAKHTFEESDDSGSSSSETDSWADVDVRVRAR